ncbi:CRTAC1 family protein, partial [bacterium]|nr:CRTAC1 family protein [bacterium]
MNSDFSFLPALFLGALVLISCQEKDSPSPEHISTDLWEIGSWKAVSEGLEARAFIRNESEGVGRFTKIDGSEIGMDFQNFLKRENIKNYLLTGAGLTIGDVDGNGLPDIFLVSQDGPNKLFKQMKPWKFIDSTKDSGLHDTKKWGAGAAFVDLDNDGDLDLFLCNKGALDEVYLNQGKGTFVGSFYGGGAVEHRAPTMVAAADYDRDGDLDLYRTETRMYGLDEMFGGKVKMMRDENGVWQAHPDAGGEYEVVDAVPREMGTQDYLFRNDGTPENPIQYKDVTKEAGIVMGKEHGLAAVWWDFDNDLNPDLYISNDFHTPDHLYRNLGDGTFSEVTEAALPYTSWSSMGSDFADINNDGWLDYLSTDMSGTSHFKQKTMMGAMVDTKWFLDHLEPRQYMRNTMQVNTGTGKFIDVAFYAGLDSTDWTWSGIFGDLDNDGFEDAFFTNGVERNVQDSDAALRHTEAKARGASKEELREIFLDGPRFKERNMVFKNHGNFQFSNEGESWNLDDETVSHGAIFSDLDRDGDLDLVVNNMNDPVGIYRNDSQGENSILVSLYGKESNRFGLGSRIEVTLNNGQTLTRVVTSSRGYMSGVEAVSHFGLGEEAAIQSMKVLWPSGVVQSFSNLDSNRHYRVSEGSQHESLPEKPENALFVKAEDRMGIEFEHEENYYDDFIKQPLLPNRLSQFGPALAVGDLNGDEKPDLFFGGAKGFSSRLWIKG